MASPPLTRRQKRLPKRASDEADGLADHQPEPQQSLSDKLSPSPSPTAGKTTTSSSLPPSSVPPWASAFFGSAAAVYGSAVALRLVLLVYGLWQDAHSPVKYTDIDYLVFTDAARFVARGESPYARQTYRYTPLLAWLLLPAGSEAAAGGSGAGADLRAWLVGQALFAWGKVLFAAADILAGWLLEQVLLRQTLPPSTAGSARATAARMYASVWLLNPMVAAISTRGSAEGLLGALVAALLWAVLVARSPILSGILLGTGVHLKIYPFIYAPAIVWWMDDTFRAPAAAAKAPRTEQAIARRSLFSRLFGFFTRARFVLAFYSLATFLVLSIIMYALYGPKFLIHTFFYHFKRIDHRHNFSPYNTQLYLSSAAHASSIAPLTLSSSPSVPPPPSTYASSWWSAERLAFAPQLLLATVLLPLVLAKKDLAGTLLAQTFAFVTFNKVCTSQYFLWYMILLPVYLPRSSFLGRRCGLLALGLWVAGQALWLQQAYTLEFLGQSTFVPGLWLASLAFFLVNCWILGVIITDVGAVGDAKGD